MNHTVTLDRRELEELERKAAALDKIIVDVDISTVSNPDMLAATQIAAVKYNHREVIKYIEQKYGREVTQVHFVKEVRR